MPKINVDSNHSFMCHQVCGVKIKQLGNVTYKAVSVFESSGPTKNECIKSLVEENLKHDKRKIHQGLLFVGDNTKT